ncbi:hypothetical protein GBF38_000468, partial [Nibea albiflora]
MTDSVPPDTTAVPDPAVVDHTAVNGQCEQADSQQQQQQQQATAAQHRKSGRGLQHGPGDEDNRQHRGPSGSLCPVLSSAGLLESSMRLKPHEAQSYRKKALWVSWVSIAITIVLAIVAFS